VQGAAWLFESNGWLKEFPMQQSFALRLVEFYRNLSMEYRVFRCGLSEMPSMRWTECDNRDHAETN
jgi:hypothetical protein